MDRVYPHSWHDNFFFFIVHAKHIITYAAVLIIFIFWLIFFPDTLFGLPAPRPAPLTKNFPVS